MHWSPTSNRSQPASRMKARKPGPAQACPPLRQEFEPMEVRCNEYGDRDSSTRRTRELFEQGVRCVVVAAHHRPQTHRPALSCLDHFLFLHWRIFCDADPPRTAYAGG